MMIALPLLVSVVLFVYYTVERQNRMTYSAYAGTLSTYQRIMENTIDATEGHIAVITSADHNFRAMAYARSQSSAYLAAYAIMEKSQMLLDAYDTLSGFFLYTASCGFYYPAWGHVYPYEDSQTIRDFVSATSTQTRSLTSWSELQLSDRKVMIYTVSFSGAVMAAMLDPALQQYSGLIEGGQIFYTDAQGVPLLEDSVWGQKPLPLADGSMTIEPERYKFISGYLDALNNYIVYAITIQSLYLQLNATQYFLLAVCGLLILSIPATGLFLRRKLLKPMDSLVYTMEAIERGDTTVLAPEDLPITEMNQINHTFNTMLSTIRQQRIRFYEQQLEVKNAQMQYLQLQLKPHFFLNCLNIIFSLAQEQKCDTIQELTVDLSAYLRSTFRDASRLVPLSSEIHGVTCYLRLQKICMDPPPRAEISLDPDTTDIAVPPLCILTFVENAIKHTRRATQLVVCIKGVTLHSDEGSYLNLTIFDNGGGFPPEMLEKLNSPVQPVYSDEHVGIMNIVHRMKFIYGGRASLFFSNRKEGACIDLFIPMKGGQMS